MATTKRTRKPKSTATPAATPEVAQVRTQTIDIQDAIRARAYEIYEDRGGEHGYDCEDWLRAEAEVLMRFGARTA